MYGFCSHCYSNVHTPQTELYFNSIYVANFIKMWCASQMWISPFLCRPSVIFNVMRSKYFAPACVMITIMVSGCINKVLLYHHFISSHFTEALPYLGSPFLSDQFDMLKFPLYMTQYLVRNYQELKRRNKTAVDNVTSACKLRNPPLISPAIEVINLGDEKVCYVLAQKALSAFVRYYRRWNLFLGRDGLSVYCNHH